MSSPAGDRFVIEGGHPVGGEVTPSGNKNEALPLLAAALLTSGSVGIENVPRIRDVSTLIELVRALGVSVDWSGDHTVTVDAAGLRESRPDAALAAVPTVGFVSHVDTATIEAARRAGVGRVLARSAFVEQLSQLLAGAHR